MVDFKDVTDLALATARRWTEESKQYPVDPAAKLLANVLDDESGLDYTVSFVDGVVRPEDEHVAAQHLHDAGTQNPKFLPWYLRFPALAGGTAAPLLPRIAVPAARKVFARLVGDLVVDVSDGKLGPAIVRLKKDGSRLNMNLLGEAVLGDREAKKRLDDTMRLLQRDDVDYVSLKVSAVTGPHNPWGYDQDVDHAVEQLLPLYQYAASAPTSKFINLDMEEYHDLHLTIDVFKKLLDRPQMLNLEAGIVLQAYLPDSLDAMKDLQEWAAQRVARGGARIKVRVVKGANLAMERVDALMHGWELTTWESKQATDANYLRILSWAMTPERVKNIRLGVAGHNLFTVAAAWELAGARGVRDSIEFEMLSGMASQQAAAVRKEVGRLLLYVPVVRPEEYDVAISYLVRRLEENSAEENFMSSIFDIATSDQAYDKEKQRFEAALAQCEAEGDSRAHSNRAQNRLEETEEDIKRLVTTPDGEWTYNNTPDSDPALPANIEWARQIRERVGTSTLGVATIEAAVVPSAEDLDALVKSTAKAAEAWAQRPAKERADILHQAGVELSRRRADLIEVAGSELGKSLQQADVEVSEAADFAHYYAQSALALENIDGVDFDPVQVTVVSPPWNFPLSIPAGGTLAALAAGSGVIFKPATIARRCGALIAECLWAAGVPQDVLKLVNVSENHLGKNLITHPLVDRVVLTGGISTAEMFRAWKPTLRIMAETSGKNAIIITPSADLDLAVRDVVDSAFGHAGQKCSACSLVILVGSVGFSKRVHDQLVDAINSLTVGWADDLSVQMGPLSDQPGEKLMAGLTKLEPGQSWVVQPRQLDDTNRLWSPGLRAGVEVGSEFHMIEYFGPVLGVMRVDTLEEAIDAQNMVDYGLTAGLHSLDAEEINYWLDHVEAGNVYVNRTITGAIVRRQPFGGWKRSVVGEGTKAGGPNYLLGFGTFHDSADSSANAPAPKHSRSKSLLDAAVKSLDPEGMAWLRRAVASDEAAVDGEFGIFHDPSQVKVERNILRYLTTPVTLRFGMNASDAQVWRGISAALALDEHQVTVSSAKPLPAGVAAFLDDNQIPHRVQDVETFNTQIAQATRTRDDRIRLICEDGDELRRALKGNVDVAVYDGELTVSGRVEILPYVHEQAVAITNHRFGDRTPLTDQVLVEA